jgi:hypothetical protein
MFAGSLLDGVILGRLPRSYLLLSLASFRGPLKPKYPIGEEACYSPGTPLMFQGASQLLPLVYRISNLEFALVVKCLLIRRRPRQECRCGGSSVAKSPTECTVKMFSEAVDYRYLYLKRPRSLEVSGTTADPS